MIGHLPTPEGVDMPVDASDMHGFLGELIIARAIDLEVLNTGIHDLTPKIWTRNTHRHEVTVLENGDGLYKMLPKTDDVGTIEATAEGDLPYRQGGRFRYINEESPIIIVGGGHPTKPQIQIFDLILHVPGQYSRAS